jgi:hypothetical protein
MHRVGGGGQVGMHDMRAQDGSWHGGRTVAQQPKGTTCTHLLG